MLKKLLMVSLVVALVPIATIHGQGEWTCDGGANDVLNAALAAETSGDLERALELAMVAEEVCADNAPRYVQAANLHARVQLELAPLDPTQEAIDLTLAGIDYLNEFHYEEALTAFEAALTLVRATNDLYFESILLNNIGEVYRRQGRLALAIDTLEQALTIRRTLGDWQGEIGTLINLGAAYSGQGQYSEAIAHYQKAVDMAREHGDHTQEATALIFIGEAYYHQGFYAQALTIFQEALTVDPSNRGIVLNDIGLLYTQQGQYALALDTLQQALTAYRQMGNRGGEAQTLSNIGLVYHHRANYEEALAYYKQALSIYREMGDQTGEAAVLPNIGTIYDEQGEYALALDAYQQALVMLRSFGNRVGEAATLHNIGVVHRKQGNYEQALNYYDAALTIRRDIHDRTGQIVTLWNRGQVYELLLQPTLAIADYQAAVDLIDSTLVDIVLEDAVASFADVEYHVRPYERLAALFALNGDLTNALTYAERGRSLLTRTELATDQIDFRANVDASLLVQETALRTAVMEAQNRRDALSQDPSASAESIQTAQSMLDEARNAYDRHLETMQLQGGYLARELTQEVAGLSRIQKTLPPDSTLILYVMGDPDSLALLITPHSLNAVLLDIPRADLDTLVTSFTLDRHTNGAALADLYQRVFAPLADQIATTQLIIAPDDSLNYVPFAALQAPDGSYLIDHYAISMIPSATALVLLNDRQPTSAPTSPALILAQPNAPALPPLNFAPLEAQEIAGILGVTAHLDATETDLRTAATGSEVIHIAAHVELDPYAPLFSVIHLGADGQHDGRFEVREIYELDLTHGTDLVVLSGCETGGHGENLGGMVRAFFAAGSPRVVASLWQVDDAATADLLTAFMENRQTMADAEALRHAMLTTRQSYPNPYYWGSFVLYGS